MVALYPLYVHQAVDSWLGQHPELARRLDWLLAELAARGVAGRPKGVVGPAREVVGLPGHRWRRSGLGGFNYYAWWFEAGEQTPGFPPASRVVRAIRPHDEVDRLVLGRPADYRERSFDALQPLNDEQATMVRSGARVRLAVGHPGTGKTGALLYAIVEQARLNPNACLLYVTLSSRLAEDARQFMEGLAELDERVEVWTFEDLLAEWSASGSRKARTVLSDVAEEDAFLGFVADQPPNELGPWLREERALWAEVRAHLIGRALPFAFELRKQPACSQPLLPQEYYRRQREQQLDGSATRAAWRLAQRFSSQKRASLHQRAWEVLGRILDGRLDRRLRHFDGVVVDEIQDLTLLQLAVLVEATRRMGASSPASFVAAGDESQVVHPSGFDWGVCKNLLRERLGKDPEEFKLTTNQRSPSPLVDASNRTAALYDELPKSYRPQAKVEAEKTEAPNGRVYVCQAAPDDPALAIWLETLRNTAGSALAVCPGVDPKALAPALDDKQFADLLYPPALLKGLDRQCVVVWEASRVLCSLRQEAQAARGRGARAPHYLAVRRTIDELRVALTRSNETLIFLDHAGAETDSLLEGLVSDGVAERTSLALLNDMLALRSDDAVERTLELFNEAESLLEPDLPRALRSLQRADAALANLRDLEYRRQALERRVEVRRRAARRLLVHAKQADGDEATEEQECEGAYRQAAEQFAEVERSYRELGQETRAQQYALLARRYHDVPPASEEVPQKLPNLLNRYVEALAELPRHELRPTVLSLPREWRDELSEVEWGSAPLLGHCLGASERLAELSGSQPDYDAARVLRRQLATLLLKQASWTEALATLEGLPEAPPEWLARCHEGLEHWTQAATLREQAGQFEQALADYRQAGESRKAARLAERLGQSELAAALRVAANLAHQLEALEQTHAGKLKPSELHRLADSLRRTAEKLAPRDRHASNRRKTQVGRRSLPPHPSL